MLATGAVALALASVPGVARAAIAGRQAAGRTTEPQSRPQEGRVLASLNGTWDFMPTTGRPHHAAGHRNLELHPGARRVEHDRR